LAHTPSSAAAVTNAIRWPSSLIAGCPLAAVAAPAAPWLTHTVCPVATSVRTTRATPAGPQSTRFPAPELNTT
jgi:hypothetical protein